MHLTPITTPRDGNTIADLKNFVVAWRAPASAFEAALEARPLAPQKRSAAGNINIAGTPYWSESRLLCRNHPSFFDEVEPGVRELVRFFVADLDIMTYTSCEGHAYPGETRFDPRHIGLLPRSRAEKEALVRFVESLPPSASLVPGGPISLGYMDHVADTEIGKVPVIDIFLLPKPDLTSEVYFAALPAAYDDFIQALKAGRHTYQLV